MTDEEMFEIMRGMDEVNNQMVKEIESKAPMCHMRRMGWDEDEFGNNYWVCDVCGHEKEF